jgi:hypothetical protein
MTWRCAQRTACLAGVLGLFLACNSPTLPTPPPVETLRIPNAQLTGDGEHVDLSGNANPGATVIAINRSLLESNPDEASAVTVATLDTGAYELRIRVDLRCIQRNVIDITQRDDYGHSSDPQSFDAPNGFEDGAVPPSDAGCMDAGSSDAGDGGTDDAGDGSIE